MSAFDTRLAEIRQAVFADYRRMYPAHAQAEFETLRKAMLVSHVIEFLCGDVPEAKELVHEVRDLLMQLRTAREVTPALRHWL